MPNRTKRVRVLLADDHALVRAGIRSLVETFNWVEVVGEASNGREALDMVGSLQPDLALLDISMSELNGLETAERIQHDFPHTCVIIISMHATPQFVSKALRSGAKGYLLKGASREELELALRTVRAGQVYLSSAISRDVIERYLEPAADLVPVTLTTRQREILQLIAESKSTKEIASILKLSAKTVESHRLQLMDRLDIRDVAGLVRYAIRQGLVSAEH